MKLYTKEDELIKAGIKVKQDLESIKLKTKELTDVKNVLRVLPFLLFKFIGSSGIEFL